MTKHVYEYGQRWDARLPRGVISSKIARLHVSTPDEAVAALITEAAVGADGFTPALVRQAVRYALVVHGRNRGLYRRVVSGRI